MVALPPLQGLAGLRPHSATCLLSSTYGPCPPSSSRYSRPARPLRGRARAIYTNTTASSPATPGGTAGSSLYELLGISKNVSLDGIKVAYRQLARKYHPDVCPPELGPEECTRRFIEVQEAYETLSNPATRAMYDYEMQHPRRVKSGEGLGQRRPWQQQRRPWEAQPRWATPAEQAEAMSVWRAQWSSQLGGLRARAAQPKTQSWAARLREQEHAEEAPSRTGGA